MNHPIRLASLLAAVVALAVPASAAPATNKFNLKPGAAGKSCVACHADFEAKLALKSVHTPVKQGACSDCHDPHASDHGKLLEVAPSKICLTCHEGIVPEGAKSVHAAVVGGDCVQCHDPHASGNADALLEAGNALCVKCHQPLAEAIAKYQFKHPPVTQNCLGCHDAHASTKELALLEDAQAAICISCHKADAPAFAKAHENYPVVRGRCTSCHDPHGSNNAQMLWPTVHAPVASRNCKQCHNDAASPDALKTKKQGLDACRACHGEVVNAALTSQRLHWPVVEGGACLACHTPHAGKESGLLAGSQKAICGDCHQDTMRRQAAGASKHAPAEQGQCSACHKPHGSDQLYLLTGNIMESCGACHDWSAHSSHPLGEKSSDPRNPNLRIDCQSCHRQHGTEHKYLAPFDHKAALCVQCHTQFRR